MKTKEEVIKEAFDMGWNSYHDCATKFDYSNSLESCLIELGGDNNGWIKIENEDDLPTPELGKEYYFISLEKNTSESEIIEGYTDKTGKYFICSKSYRIIYYDDTFYKITHYQPNIKPLKPLKPLY